MKHYPHHIGDFDQATRHLTRIERSIYRDLIDMYYDTEKPLPKELKVICRKVLARTDEEVTAVEQVLNEFFILSDDGWFNSRCDSEIESYKSNNSQKAIAGKASAAAKALKKQQMLNGNSTSVEQPLNACSTDEEQTNNGTSTNHKPSTINQSTNNTSSKRETIFQEPVDTRHKFQMFFGWQVSPNFLTERKGYGFKPDFFNEQVLTEFCGFWMGKNEKLTQGEWEHKLATNLAKLTRNPSLSTGTPRKSNVPDNNTTDWMSDEVKEMLNAESN